MNLKRIYVDGWRVFGRWFVFSLILGVIQLPFNLGMEYLVEKGIITHVLYFYPLAVLLCLITIYPLILYAVSEWTGEFIAPRINRKKLRERSNRPFGEQNNSSQNQEQVQHRGSIY